VAIDAHDATAAEHSGQPAVEPDPLHFILHFETGANGGVSEWSTIMFDLPYRFAVQLCALATGKVRGWLDRMSDEAGMIYSAVCYLMPKIISFLNRIAGPDETPIPKVPKGADPVEHVTEFILGEMPTNLAGLTMTLWIDLQGEVVRLETAGRDAVRNALENGETNAATGSTADGPSGDRQPPG
jgi:hypothetical protein